VSVFAVRVLARRRLGARVGEPGGFFHGVAIHVAAVHHHRPVAVPHDTHDAGLADAGLDLAAERLELVRHDARRANFHERQFLILVDVLEYGDQPLGIGVNGGVGVCLHSRSPFRAPGFGAAVGDVLPWRASGHAASPTRAQMALSTRVMLSIT
jgi:hypothetical protein